MKQPAQSMGAAKDFFWTDLALEELSETVEYLRQEFSENEGESLGNEIEKYLEIILQNPLLFPLCGKNVRKAVILKYNSMYYRLVGTQIQILSFFSNRKNPQRRNFDQ